MFLIITPITRILTILEQQGSLTVFHVVLPVSFVIDAGVKAIKVDSIPVLLSILPKTLIDNGSLLVSLIL
jgi:hypothetical protein